MVLSLSVLRSNSNMCNNSSRHNTVRCNYNRPPHYVTIPVLFLVIFHLCFSAAAAGRTLGHPVSHFQLKEEKLSLSGQIGSRPPRCEKRCISCDHCQAIQIPTNHLNKDGRSKISNGTRKVYKVTYSRSDENSNYKPMSWKCKCGNIIFNP